MVEVSYDKSGNPVFTFTGSDGKKAVFTYDQALAKYYHSDVYNLEQTVGFNRGLKPKERKAYIEQTVPRDKIIEFQKANVASFSSENFLPVPGFIGTRKDAGTLYINTSTGQVHFVNEITHKWRTTIVKTNKQLKALAKDGFHLFPNAGK